MLTICSDADFAQMADATHIVFSVFFSLSSALAMQCLFYIRLGLEDPFVRHWGSCHDAVDLEREMEKLKDQLHAFLEEFHNTSSPDSRRQGR